MSLTLMALSSVTLKILSIAEGSFLSLRALTTILAQTKQLNGLALDLEA